MCCRYLFGIEEDEDFTFPITKMREIFEMKYKDIPFPTGDMVPSLLCPIFIKGDKKANLIMMKWGFENPRDKKLIINCKSETMNEKYMFKKFTHNRCVILINGFYEWTQDNIHQKYFFHIDKKLIYLCGIYNDKNEFVILTKEANESMRGVHHRMPVICSQENVNKWLDEKDDYSNILLKEDGPTLLKTIC